MIKWFKIQTSIVSGQTFVIYQWLKFLSQCHSSYTRLIMDSYKSIDCLFSNFNGTLFSKANFSTLDQNEAALGDNIAKVRTTSEFKKMQLQSTYWRRKSNWKWNSCQCFIICWKEKYSRCWWFISHITCYCRGYWSWHKIINRSVFEVI